MILNTIFSSWFPIFNTKGLVISVTSPELTFLPSMTRTTAGLFFLILAIPCFITNSTSIKQAEAPESIRVSLTFMYKLLVIIVELVVNVEVVPGGKIVQDSKLLVHTPPNADELRGLKLLDASWDNFVLCAQEHHNIDKGSS